MKIFPANFAYCCHLRSNSPDIRGNGEQSLAWTIAPTAWQALQLPVPSSASINLAGLQNR